MHKYIPPVPGLIQQSVNSGKLGIQMLQPGRLVHLDFADHLKPGDSLGLDVELPTNRLLAVAVANWLDTPRDAIVLNGMMSVLPDCTICAERANLEAKAKEWVSRSRIPVTGGSRPEPPEYLSIGRNHAAS